MLTQFETLDTTGDFSIFPGHILTLPIFSRRGQAFALYQKERFVSGETLPGYYHGADWFCRNINATTMSLPFLMLEFDHVQPAFCAIVQIVG